MAKKLQFYRGPKASMPTLAEGEPGYTTDEKKLYIGDGAENIGLVKDEDIADMVTAVGGASIDIPKEVTGPVQIILTEEEEDETGGSFYVSIAGGDGTYTSDHSAQEIYEAYQADKAVFAKIGENIIPLTHVSLSGSTYSAQFNVFSGIEGYQGILITQSGETKHVYVTDNQPSADGVSYNNGTSGLEATDMQSAVDEVAGKFGNFIPSSQKGVSGGVATLDGTGKLTEAQKPAYTATEVGARPSTWTPSAEDVGAIAATEKGANNGVATLDETGKLSSSQKPTYTATEVGARPSTWTPSAEDVGAIAATEKGANNGVAELDGNGKIPAAQLPSYVDDVVDAYVVGGTPYAQDWLSAESGGAALTPEGSKIYLVVSEGEYQNREYRWSGTQYAQISEGLALGETQDTAYRGDHGKAAYDHSQLTSGNPHHVTAGDVGLGNVNNTSDTDKPVSTAQQTALDLKQNKLTGTQGQYVGFDSSGNAIAQEAPSGLPEGGTQGQLLAKGASGAEWVDNPTRAFGPQTVATSAWAADTTYSAQGYGFRASVPLSGVTASHIPDVTFAMADAVSGNLAPLADTYDGGLYIYAKEQPTATVNIASVVCTKGA